MKQKPVILWLSDSPFTNTGYATISRNILNGLSDEFECHYLAHNYMGQTIPENGVTLQDGLRFKFTIHGAGREGYCRDLIEPYIQKFKPDFFCVLLDTFMGFQVGMQNINFAPAKSLFYFPSDGGGGMPQGCEQILKHFNIAVAMAEFGKIQTKDYYNLNTEFIPHAVDCNLFRPINHLEKSKIKSEFSVLSINGQLMKGFLHDKFVVGTVARNQGRKMLDKTIKAFYEFAKNKKNVVLLLHSDLFDASAVFDLRSLISRYNLENKVVFSPIRFFDNFEYKDMYKVYGLMDVFMLSTSGEGFGVPIIEAMSCGIPSVVTDYTTTPELLVKNGVCGIPVPLSDSENISMTELMLDKGMNMKEIDLLLSNGTLTGSWSVERGCVDIKKFADSLNLLYADKEKRLEMGQVGRNKAITLYNWESVINQWKDLFRRYLNV